MLDKAFNSQRNSLDFLRFALAFAVIVVHGFWLGGFGPDPLEQLSHGQISLGPVAVAGFFVLSGFLITKSRQRHTSFWKYIWQRARRILPGFWACLIVTVLLLAPIIYWLTNSTLAGYWQQSPFGPVDYLTNNFFLKISQDRIGNLLQNHPTFPYLINGSLWTLYDEFKCYLIIGVLGIIGATQRRRWLVAIFTAGVVAVYLFEYFSNGLLRQYLPYLPEAFFLEHLAYFLIGSTAYLYAEKVPVRRSLFILSIVLYFVGCVVGGYKAIALFVYPYTLMWLTVRLPIEKWAKYGDFSYGLYLYAFPIERILAQLNVPRLGVWIYILLSTVVTLVFAVLSYYLVEARFFKRQTSDSRAAKPAAAVRRFAS